MVSIMHVGHTCGDRVGNIKIKSW